MYVCEACKLSKACEVCKVCKVCKGVMCVCVMSCVVCGVWYVMFFLGTVRVGSVCKELVSLYVQMCIFFLATCNLLINPFWFSANC